MCRRRVSSTAKGSGLKVVYTPLNGAGESLRDRDFCGASAWRTSRLCRSRKTPTAISPPAPTRTRSSREALQKGLELCETVQPDLLVATDPDCDRAWHCGAGRGQR